MPGKSTPFTPSSILFRPRNRNQRSVIDNQIVRSDYWLLITDSWIGGVAGYCPRVRMVYYDGHLSP